jgi:hypothetical protein
MPGETSINSNKGHNNNGTNDTHNDNTTNNYNHNSNNSTNNNNTNAHSTNQIHNNNSGYSITYVQQVSAIASYVLASTHSISLHVFFLHMAFTSLHP